MPEPSASDYLSLDPLSEPSIDPLLDYGSAVGELEAILARLESTAVDVDELAQQVRRAAILIDHCRSRLHVVEADVGGVLSELGQRGSDPTPNTVDESTP